MPDIPVTSGLGLALGNWFAGGHNYSQASVQEMLDALKNAAGPDAVDQLNEYFKNNNVSEDDQKKILTQLVPEAENRSSAKVGAQLGTGPTTDSQKMSPQEVAARASDIIKQPPKPDAKPAPQGPSWLSNPSDPKSPVSSDAINVLMRLPGMPQDPNAINAMINDYVENHAVQWVPVQTDSFGSVPSTTTTSATGQPVTTQTPGLTGTPKDVRSGLAQTPYWGAQDVSAPGQKLPFGLHAPSGEMLAGLATGKIKPLSKDDAVQLLLYARLPDLVVQAQSTYYMQTKGHAMPADLQAQIRSKVASLPVEAKKMLFNDPTESKVGGAGIVNTMIATYDVEHPTEEAVAAQAHKRINDRIQGYLGHVPADAFAKLGANPTDEQIDAYVDTQPSGIAGLSYGEYSKQKSRVDSLWEKYFGKTPDPNVYGMAAGMSEDDLQNYIDKQPSHIEGINIGRYTGLTQEIQNIQTKTGHMGDMNWLTQNINQSLGK